MTTTAAPALPVYRAGAIPPELETMSGLKRLRRRLRDGQRPVATLVYGHHSDRTGLYRIVDTLPLPPLSAAQRAAAEARRAWPYECGRCGLDTGQAIRVYPPLCGACAIETFEDGLRERRADNRARASTWAQGVLSGRWSNGIDGAPPAVIVATATIGVHLPEGAPYGRWKRRAACDIAVVDLDGWLRHWVVCPQERPERRRDVPPGAVPIVEVAADIADALRGHRIVGWHSGIGSDLWQDLRDAAIGYRAPYDPAWSQPTQSGTLCEEYSRWVGEIGLGRDRISAGYVRQMMPRFGAGDRASWMFRQVQRMAASPQRGTPNGADVRSTTPQV